MIAAGLDTRLGELDRMMYDAPMHRVLIVARAGKVVGIVSSTDILAAVAAE